MTTTAKAPRRRFAGFVLDAASGHLMHEGRLIKIQPQPLRVLSVLVERAGEIVSRDELRDRVWDSATFVEFDLGLNYAIRQIRVALDDDAASPVFLETVKKRGYRFIAAVSVEPDSPDGVERASAPHTAPSRRTVALPAAVAGLVVAGVVAAWSLARWTDERRAPGPVREFQPVTDFADSAMAPSLSPDGRLIAFIRGARDFLTPDQIYVKMLPDGEPRRLTDDPRPKYGPAFSPDGSEVAYTVFERSTFSTYTVPVLGGEPRLLLTNAAGLTWLDPTHVLFSQIRSGQHMGTVTSTTSRDDLRELYFPAHERAMAHYASAAPDRRSALVVEMGPDGAWTSCRLIALDRALESHPVGPAGRCDSAAWSPDGEWMFFTAIVGEGQHLWRQHYPDGVVEQLTFGPTSEAGVAVERDGRSLITSAGIGESTLWLHQSSGERQLSWEGRATTAGEFSADGAYVYHLVELASAGGRRELRRTAVATGAGELVLPGISVLDFDVSADGRQVVYTTATAGGSTELWLAPTDRSAPARRIGATGDTSPHFGPAGAVLFRFSDGRFNYLGRMNADGSGRSKVVPFPISGIQSVSPARHWVMALAFVDQTSLAPVAISLRGGPIVRICQTHCDPVWSSGGRYLFVPEADASLTSPGRTLAIPVGPEETLPSFPASGLPSSADASTMPGATVIARGEFIPGPDVDTFAYVQTSVHRNLFRVTLP